MSLRLPRYLNAPPRVRRAVFVAYALLVFTATHWPALHFEVPGVQRPDLFIHFAAFGLWYVLFVAAEFVGPWLSWRSIGLSALIALAYAGLDEWSQSLPILKRTAVWDDFAANAGGVALGCVVVCLAREVAKWRSGKVAK